MSKSQSAGLFQQFQASFRRLASFQERLVLAVSGGSDSMALLHLAAAVCATEQLCVGFVDHGLRDGVDKEWMLVRTQCDKLGIAAEKLVIVDKYGEETKGEGIQQWARLRRYELLNSYATAVEAAVILTAHTLDDQAETVLLRILRGTGIDGLGAIPAQRQVSEHVRVARPMLQLGRESIRDWLREHDIPWVEDPSNQNAKFARVQVRELMPLLLKMNPSIQSHLGELAGEAQATTAFFDEYVKGNNVVKLISLGDGCKVLHESFASVSRTIAGRFVRSALHTAQGDLRRFERYHIEAILDGVFSRAGAHRHDVPGSLEVWTAYGDVYVFSSPASQIRSSEEQKMALGASNCVKGALAVAGVQCEITVTNSSNVSDLFPVTLRMLKPGDRLYGRRRKASRLMIDKKVPIFYRHLVPAICTQENEIISIPGILNSLVSGLRMDWRLRVNSALRDLWQFGEMDVL
ncbi:MAG: tRNA lysidine(34) synthetase TilS [Deltaproteobacteria bacterium]|nr:tRNA lysidine(34) synthetase TilS [Deltaproteobacteria bacterium]MBN2670888.1 tRNA lysidine(34) synthetase TilS [Deltaproteobacteria bacterium]